MIGVVVVGAGRWGKGLVRNYAFLPGSELKYICDLSREVPSEMAAGVAESSDCAAAVHVSMHLSIRIKRPFGASRNAA